MRQASGQSGPPLWQQCEVCVAAAEFVKARDSLVETGMAGIDEDQARNHPIIKRVRLARERWAYARGARHTGPVHTPRVV